MEIKPISVILTISTRAGEDVAALVKLIGHHPLLCRLALVLAHVDSAPLEFGKFPPEHQRDQKLYTIDGLRQALVSHFVSGALQNTRAIIGSHEFLGAPRVFFNSLGTGLNDFIQKPGMLSEVRCNMVFVCVRACVTFGIGSYRLIGSNMCSTRFGIEPN
jgi:hypothetical protein